MTDLSHIPMAFVGGGTMAEACIRALLGKGLTVPQCLVASEPLAERRAYLERELGIRTTASNVEAVVGAQLIVLAIKPQVLGRVLADLDGRVPPGTLVLSIVAGARLDALARGLGARAIVRIMPNTPAQIGEGMSVWTATPETSTEQRELARRILGAMGEELFVENEDHVDMATALSGSGPAYVFLFIEALIDAGVQMGLARPAAERLALQTVRGSALYAQQSGQHPAVLRNAVTSPGGTTAAALHELEQGAFRALIARAVLAAHQRARQLGEPK